MLSRIAIADGSLSGRACRTISSCSSSRCCSLLALRPCCCFAARGSAPSWRCSRQNVLGPHGLELVADGETTLRGFTEFGVVLLLFLIGLETQPARLWRMRRHVFRTGHRPGPGDRYYPRIVGSLARWGLALGCAGARLWSRLVVDGFRSSASAGELGAAELGTVKLIFSPPVTGSGGGTAARIDATAG